MSRQTEVYQWTTTVRQQLPQLSKAQATVLALWSFGVVVVGGAGSTSVASFVAQVFQQKENTVRQRLRGWYVEATAKRGQQRQSVEVAACFGALVRWVLAWWAPDELRLALALDATTLAQRFTVLTASVVYRGCAIPVAWVVMRANEPAAWRHHWLKLLTVLGGSVPKSWTVIVRADRG